MMQQHSIPTPYMVGEVHFYTAESDDGAWIFDCGPPLKEGRDALEKTVDFERLRHVFLTHCHIDHYGLAPWLEGRSGATIWLSGLDLAKLVRREEHEAKTAELLHSLGFGPAFMESMRESFRRTTVTPVDFSRYRTVENTEPPAGLGWLACPGHSQGDLVWLSGDEAVSGDVILRGIFQVPLLDLDLSAFEGRFRNYEAWCDSIPKLGSLRGKRILPGHRETVDIDSALVDYATTLFQRAALVKRHRRLPVPDIVDEIFRGRLIDPFFVYLKASEIVFMLDFLDDPKRLERAFSAVGLMDRVAEPYFDAISDS